MHSRFLSLSRADAIALARENTGKIYGVRGSYHFAAKHRVFGMYYEAGSHADYRCAQRLRTIHIASEALFLMGFDDHEIAAYFSGVSDDARSMDWQNLTISQHITQFINWWRKKKKIA